MSEFDFRSEVSQALSLTESELARLIARAPHTYKVYSIPKKNGGRRVIAQPARETKIIQKFLMGTIFKGLPVHECATAYSPGSSIAVNASRHAGNSYVSKFDFRNFFPSISASDLIVHFKAFLGVELSDRSAADLARVCCIKPKGGDVLCLSVGAPSSPVLSNSVMFGFDGLVSDWCSKRDVIFTRYADDLTFSSNEKMIFLEIETLLREVVAGISYPKLLINDEKTVHVSKKCHRRVTGLVLSSEGKVSLGRKRKREISAMIHRFSLGQLAQDDVFKLQGLLGFANDAEPDFISRMEIKYGREVVLSIFNKRKPPLIISRK